MSGADRLNMADAALGPHPAWCDITTCYAKQD